MKHIQIRADVDPDLLPEFYSVAAASPAITELRVLDWNVAADDVGTLLYAIDGDCEVFREGVRKTDAVETLTVSNTQKAPSYACLSARPAAVPFFSAFMSVTARADLIVRKPLVYRDGQSHAHVVGDADPLQEAIDRTPAGIDVVVEQISQFPSGWDDPLSQLSSRQREAIDTALRMGYYNQPRDVTHADIAGELGCAPNTATTHLQKAEAKIVGSVIDGRL